MMDENQLRSTMGMFRVGAMPHPAGEPLSQQDLTHGSLAAFRRLVAQKPDMTWAQYLSVCSVWVEGYPPACYAPQSPTNPAPYYLRDPPTYCFYCWTDQINRPTCLLAQQYDQATWDHQCDGLLAVAPIADPRYSYDAPKDAQGNRYMPQLWIAYQGGYTDAEGYDDRELVGYTWQDPDGTRHEADTWRYYLRAPGLTYQPCLSNADYCPFITDSTIGICRWYTQNAGDLDGAAGWHMECNQPLINQPMEAQSSPRPITVAMSFRGPRAPVMVRFSAGHACFWLEDRYCFNSGCLAADAPDRWWYCVTQASAPGNSDMGWDMYRALSMYLIADPAINSDPAVIGDGGIYPHARVRDIAVKNLVWRAVADGLTAMYYAGLPSFRHASEHSEGFQQPEQSLWTLAPEVALQNPNEPDSPHRSVGPISMDDMLTKIGTVVELELESVSGGGVLNVERRMYKRGGRWLQKRCVFGGIQLVARVRPKKRTLARPQEFINAGLYWLHPDDWYDFAIENPMALGTEHPVLKLLATNPAGSPIPYLLCWDGLKAAQPYSVEADVYSEARYQAFSDIHAEYTGCCYTLQALNDAVIFGEVNNHADPAGPQLLQGSCGFRVPGLGSPNPGPTYGCQPVP